MRTVLLAINFAVAASAVGAGDDSVAIVGNYDDKHDAALY